MKFLPKNVKDRSRGLGGSDVGSLFGLNPHVSLPQLWLAKTGKLHGNPPDTEPMEWGRIFEDTVAKRFAQKTKRLVRRVNRTIQHPKYAFMLANPDRLQWKRRRMGVLEIKATIFGNLKAWSAGGIPPRFYLQLQHYLEVTGCDWGSFCVLFGGNRLCEFDVPRDQKVIDVMIEREGQFWELVQTQTPPTITLSTEWNKVMAAYFPVMTPKSERIVATPEAIGRARRYLRLNDRLEKIEAECDEHEVFFKEQIADCNHLVVPKIARFTWSQFNQSRIDLAKLRAEHPELAAELTISQPTRRFSVKALEEVAEEEDAIEEPFAPIFAARRIELD